MPRRIAALDLVRGVAVLGIVAVNILSFAGPDSANYSPDLPRPGSTADEAVYFAVLVLFEGKMRALFTLLFGASMLLFIERADDQGRDGARLQVRRLGWLALFGYLHFVLLWDGDILFLYAAVGLAALSVRRAEPLPAVAAGLLLLTFWQGAGTALYWPVVSSEAAVRTGTASTAQTAFYEGALAEARGEDRDEAVEARLGFVAQARSRLTDRPWMPLLMIAFNFGETFPLMLIGIALYRTGFFSGGWPRRRMWQLAGFGMAFGGTLTLGFAGWAQANRYPEFAMQLAIHFLLEFPHLMMALGYAALLVLAAPRLLQSVPGQRLEAAGRMAFSNYIGTSLVMVGLFTGWGLEQFDRFGTARAWLFVPATWLLMLAWSKPWLGRFRQGPLEWAWRSLTERRWMPIRR